MPKQRFCLKCHKPILQELMKKDRRICDKCFGKIYPEDDLWDEPLCECSYSSDLIDMVLDINPIHRLIYG